jgi:starvation-inducible DNA-binding protein
MEAIMATTKVTKTTAVKGAITPNIGLEEKNRQQLVELLNKRLSDTFVLYTKTLNYHWNVTGIEFSQLHALFRGQYEQLAEAIDEIAERVRKLGGFALGTLDEFKQNSAIDEQPGRIPNAEQMIRNLLADHEVVIRQLRHDADKAEELKDMTTNDFLIGLAEDHETMAWMLRAHLENAVK